MTPRLRPLGTLTAKVGSGATPRGGKAVYRAEGTAFIRSQNVLDNGMKLDDVARITDEAAHQLRGVAVQAGDVLLNITGDSIARTCVVDPSVLPARVSQHVAIIRTIAELDGRYLQRYLVQPSTKEYLLSISDGGTRKALTKAGIEALMVPVPPIEEQRAIAEVLGALDDKIAANRATESTAEELIATWYRHSVHSDAVSVPLMHALDITFGEPFGGPHFSEPGVGRPLIRIRDLKTFESQVWTTEHRPKERIIRPGDVVVGMDAEFRPTWWLGTEGLLNQRVLQASGSGFGAALTLEALKAPLSRIEGYKTGTTVIHLNKSDLLRETVLLPGEDALNRFERQAEPVLRHRVSLATERRALAAMRDLLLPQLMSGKIRVREAERIVEGAV